MKCSSKSEVTERRFVETRLFILNIFSNIASKEMLAGFKQLILRKKERKEKKRKEKKERKIILF